MFDTWSKKNEEKKQKNSWAELHMRLYPGLFVLDFLDIHTISKLYELLLCHDAL